MISILSEYPLLLLFTVASLGYLLGNIKIKGYSLGVAAILFTGLAFGAIDPQLQIPDIVFRLGLSIFVYSIGLSSGPAFFDAFRKNGSRDFVFAFAMVLFSGAIAVVLWYLFDFSPAIITGIYTGSTTNTAALASVIDYINNAPGSANSPGLIEDAVVAYSFTYPMGIIGSMLAIVILEKLFKIDYEAEKKSLSKDYPLSEQLHTTALEVTREALCGIALRDLLRDHQWNVSFGRFLREGDLGLVNFDTQFQKGDIVMAGGSEEDLDQVVFDLGQRSDYPLAFDRSRFEAQRIFVSNPEVAGRTIASLNLYEKFNAVITRIRRGDIDMLAKGDTVLELGDRIRFVADKKDLKSLSKLFGDSYHASSKVDLFSFGLGIGLGLIIGSIEVSLGSDISFKLGFAGGPLVVGLILGALRRTGPILWSLPYSANVTLQQIGLILLLATIGVSSGYNFVNSLSIDGISFFIAGSILSLLTAFSILGIGYKLLKMPFSLLLGMVANQPAILDFASSRAGNRIPLYGYAMIFPIAIITKIVIAQLLFIFLSGT